MNIKDIRKKKSEILAISKECGATNIRLFGSVVRDEITKDSDIDFLVNFEPNRSLFDQSRLKWKLEEIFKRKVDVVSETELNEYIKDSILKESLEI